MPEPTFADVDELVGPATPHFAYQLRARVRELVLDLPEEHPVRQYAEKPVRRTPLEELGLALGTQLEAERERGREPHAGCVRLLAAADTDAISAMFRSTTSRSHSSAGVSSSEM